MDDFSKPANKKPLPGRLSEISWETKIKQLLPDVWKLKDEWATEKANIKDLLTHTWGLPRSDNVLARDSDALDIIKRLQYIKPAYELRQKWCYSNIVRFPIVSPSSRRSSLADAMALSSSSLTLFSLNSPIRATLWARISSPNIPGCLIRSSFKSVFLCPWV